MGTQITLILLGCAFAIWVICDSLWVAWTCQVRDNSTPCADGECRRCYDCAASRQ